MLESSGEPPIGSVGLSHLSVEVGHLYFEDFRQGVDFLKERFTAVAPWVEHARKSRSIGPAVDNRRVSTCYLIDDYFAALQSPAEVIPRVLEAADAAGVAIDYLARESGCAAYDAIGVAELVTGWIVDEPPEGSNGVRPPLTVTGWLSNGQRSERSRPAMRPADRPPWEPPRENARNNHSVFIDVELWSDPPSGRLWSCPLLASVWQLARLGLIRYEGRPLLQPVPWAQPWPDEWQALPPVIKLNDRAKPFSAYHTLSILDHQFLPIEHAVRTILSQVAVEQAVGDQIRKRAAADSVELSADPLDRIGYVFQP